MNQIVPAWFSVKGAAAYTGFSVSSIEAAIREDRFPSRLVKIKGVAKARRIKREDLDAWIIGEAAEPSPEPSTPEGPPTS